MKIGEKIKQRRLERGMTQEELADRCELTKGYISQLERNLTSPSIATLQNILECLGTSLTDFFHESEAEPVIFRENDHFVKVNGEKKYAIHWIVPDAKKRGMEPIFVELDIQGETIKEEPHQGEEFGLVLQGNVQLNLGKEKMRLKKGDCFQYKPDKEHFIKNIGKTAAKILWISSPPSF